MGLNFRKSIKVADGVKLNIGKKSAGVSVGGKYGGVSYNTKSGARVRASLPGTGLSYTKSLNSVGKKGKSKSKSKSSTKKTVQTILTVLIVLVAVIFLIHKNWDKISDTLGLGKQAAVTAAADSTGTGVAEAIVDTAAGTASGDSVTYVINTNTKKIHVSTCSYADTTSKNMEETDKALEELLGEGYEKCSRCLK